MMKNLYITFILFIAISTGVNALGQDAAPIPNPEVTATNTVIDGVIGPGALYRIVKPDNWNGGLVLFAHASVGRTEPIALPATGDVLAPLVAARGYAFAYSSFSENGWAVKDGTIRTHQLIGIFSSKFGEPSRVYITGASMGGLIAIKLAEQYPDEFVGSLPVCAPAGGTRMFFDYAANVRALFDVFYPGELPGDAVTMPADTNVNTEIRDAAIAAMTGDMSGANNIAAVNQTPLPGSTATQIRTSVYTALGINAWASMDAFPPELQGRSAFDNRQTEYTSGSLSSTLLAQINEDVTRYDAAPSVLNYMNSYYYPTGNLQMPMYTLRTSFDPNVPAFHMSAYAGRVAAAGRSDLLYQRTITRSGHCSLTPTEIMSAFDALTLWVEGGIPPTP